MDGDVPGKVAVRKSAKLSGEQWENFRRRLDRAHFWQMPTEVAEDENVQDGDELILEGVMVGKYHIVDRASPLDPGDPYTSLCQYVLGLSGLDVMKAWNEYRGDR